MLSHPREILAFAAKHRYHSLVEEVAGTEFVNTSLAEIRELLGSDHLFAIWVREYLFSCYLIYLRSSASRVNIKTVGRVQSFKRMLAPLMLILKTLAQIGRQSNQTLFLN